MINGLKRYARKIINRLFGKSQKLRKIDNAKIERIRNILKEEFKDSFNGKYFDCLNSEYSKIANIEETENISKNPYDPQFENDIILGNPDKLILDVGSGFRPLVYKNVINLEIVPYSTTEVLGIAEELPFIDSAFDFVHSNAVLEHIRNPFKAAEEMVRVAKPGAILYNFVPFLQPFHGYPNHYYNMTYMGLSNLFSKHCKIINQSVPHYYHPIYALDWFIRQYTWRLGEGDVKEFLDLKLADIAAVAKNPQSYGFVKNLPLVSQFELCSGSLLIAQKI